ncbi:MAG TPA: FHA domain-containing protein [Solirubrobacteraceae bacterium]|jgi:pSer/pThr/pTyr-binding forkhead associated (FHA) protein
MSAASTYLRLEVISGVSPGSTLVVEDELVIGRHATGPGRLSEDEEISRQHARISREAAGNYAIEDLGSSNGTFVNGLRIQSPKVLDIGDSIETGATTMVVRAVVEPEPEPVAEPQATPAASARAAPTVFARVPVVEETPAEQIPPPALKLEIDFDAREARIALGDGGETVRLVFADGAWRVG